MRPLFAVRKAETRRQREDRARAARRLSDQPGARDDKAVESAREIARRMEPRAAERFLEAVRVLRRSMPVEEIAAAIQRGDIGAVMRPFEVAGNQQDRSLPGLLASGGPEGFVGLITEAMARGAEAGRRQLPPREAALAPSLDLTNPEAVKFLREMRPRVLQDITTDSRRAIQSLLQEGLQGGRPPREIARDVRQHIGLTSSASAAVSSFRRQLETGLVGGATAPWDRRLSGPDMQRARSIMEDDTATVARIDDLVERYAQSLLNRRAESIAHTEIHQAQIAGQEALWSQAQDAGLLRPERTRRIWIVTPDERLRDSHRAVPIMNPDGVPLGQPFDTPVGPVMAPGQSGDPAFDIECRCTLGLVILE